MTADKELHGNGEFYKAVIDNLTTNVCVTDVETGELIYTNSKDLPVDRKYEDQEKNIAFNGRCYQIRNAIDVTEYVRLSENASVDELTGMPGRRAGKEKLARMIHSARHAKKILTVAMYDINELKLVNDKFGHSEGDRLLRYVADLTREHLNPKDMVFRLSGDEFIIVFYNENREDAERYIRNIQQQLKDRRVDAGIFYNVSFSYGLMEVYPGDTYTVSDILSRADEQMYIQKRNYHIMLAQQALEKTLGRGTIGRDNFLFDKEHLFDALVCGTDDYLFVGNLKTGVFRYSPSMVDEFGLPGEVVENAAAFWGKLIHPDDQAGFLESNQEIADGRTDYHSIEYRAKNIRGAWIWLRCRGKMIRDDQGRPNMFAGMISNLGKSNQVDHMTGLYNRFEFEGAAKKYLVDYASTRHMGIMILDMDAFKNINDLYDRSFGDEVLRLTAQKISAMLPVNARIYRMDGDEFGIITLNGDVNEVFDIFARIQAVFGRQQEQGSRKYYCTISAGYASYPQDADNYQDLLKCANYSLEHAKAMGKNQLSVYDSEISKKKERSLELTQLLRESIERGFAGFSLHYQPQVFSGTGRLYGAEALARWHCSKYGDISPVEFIPLLEQTGLIVPAGTWILRQAAAQCKAWRQYMPDFHISINLSYRQLLEGNIVSEVRELLQSLELPPDNVTLELTETYLVKMDDATRDILDGFKKIGVRLAMDDFGVGYSSLFSLRKTPVDIVKIDREFVKGIPADVFNVIFIRSITDLCHNVGKTVCLEGVETADEYKTVKENGLELIQGYHFGRPMPPEDFKVRYIDENIS